MRGSTLAAFSTFRVSFYVLNKSMCPVATHWLWLIMGYLIITDVIQGIKAVVHFSFIFSISVPVLLSEASLLPRVTKMHPYNPRPHLQQHRT